MSHHQRSVCVRVRGRERERERRVSVVVGMSEASLCTAQASSSSQLSSSGSSRREWLTSEVYGALHTLVPDAKNLVLKPLKGAMTNYVYECHWSQEEEEAPDGSSIKRVLVRVYGDGCDLFFNRDDEIYTFERMSQLGQGPRLLARFSNGRIEEFLNARTFKAIDFRDPIVSARLAIKLREFHQLDIQGPCEPHLWNRIRFWINKALEICPPTWHTEFQLANLNIEISKLQNRLSEFKGVIGFCHNDLQHGNIMMNETNGGITIIDYEYASFNPIAFDIANHFCEMAANYDTEEPHKLDSSKYPDFEERSRFIKAYLKPSIAGSRALPSAEKLLEEVEGYTPASHVHWGLWGILSATFSDIDFNYMEYARQRFHNYACTKPLL